MALRLLQQGDEANVLWEQKFYELAVSFADKNRARVTSLAKGNSYAEVQLIPADSEKLSTVQWSIVTADQGVKIEIGASSGHITVPDTSEDGYAIIEARISDNLFTRVRAFVGCLCSECKKLGNCDQRLDRGVDLTFSLGLTEDGLSSGDLYVVNDNLDADTFSRKSVLLSTTHATTEAVGDNEGLRQVKAPGTFVLIDDLGAAEEPVKGYKLSFYPPSIQADTKKDATRHAQAKAASCSLASASSGPTRKPSSSSHPLDGQPPAHSLHRLVKTRASWTFPGGGRIRSMKAPSGRLVLVD